MVCDMMRSASKEWVDAIISRVQFYDTIRDMECESYRLFLDQTPKNGKFDRVHAVLVTDDERILVRYKNDNGRITGGHIDPEDANLEVALRRELKEEINCEIDQCDYVGYLEVKFENGTVENWARMVARLSDIGEPQPDPDRAEKWIYGRTLAPAEIAKVELTKSAPFGDTDKLVDRAMELARAKNYFTKPANHEVKVLNFEEHEKRPEAIT